MNCAACSTDLTQLDTIIAAEGQLFCSKECCIKTIDGNFDEVAEEISPADIGLVKKQNSFMTAGRCKIAAILCHRDDCTFEEAEGLIRQAIEQMDNICYCPDECEDILANILGLEPDYIFDLL